MLTASLCAEPEFVDLFNGRDLSGWVNVNGAEGTWSVKDGVIHCTGKPICALRTERQYENFVMELEWRHLKSGGNAGIFIWASPIAAKGQPFLRAVEVQVLDHGYGNTAGYTTHGDVFPIHGSKMKPHGRHRGMRSFPSENRSKPSPEWNSYRIECKDGVLRLHVNGKEVSGGSDCDWRKGYIGLESEGSPVEFRNIRLQELPAGDATPEQSAPEETGFRPLYNGVNIMGWSAAGKSEGWQAADWKFVRKVGKEGGRDTIYVEEGLRPGTVIWDAKVPADGADGSSVVFVDRLEGQQPEFTPILLIKDGKWHRYRCELGAEIVLSIDGMRVLRPDARVIEGEIPERSFGLSAAGSLEFANIYYRQAE